MQPSTELPLLDPMAEALGLVLCPDCEPDMEPPLEVLGEVVLVLGVVVWELELELWPLLMLDVEVSGVVLLELLLVD